MNHVVHTLYVQQSTNNHKPIVNWTNSLDMFPIINMNLLVYLSREIFSSKNFFKMFKNDLFNLGWEENLNYNFPYRPFEVHQSKPNLNIIWKVANHPLIMVCTKNTKALALHLCNPWGHALWFWTTYNVSTYLSIITHKIIFIT